MSMNVNLVPHSPLTQNDILRMPKNMSMSQAAVATKADAYAGGKKKSSFFGKIVKLAVVAAAIVALKRFGQNSFLKVSDPNNMKFLDKVKNGIVKLGGWIETPFIKGYNSLKGLISKKAVAETVTETATEAAKAVA